MSKWLIRSEEANVSDSGKYPGKRTVEELLKNGIILLDKPQGPSSHQVDAWIKEVLHINKCSHGGTLDPRVSGVLLIALEKATKLMPILLSSKKEYVALVKLHKEAPVLKIREVCEKFVGKIKQLPPKKSAVARRVREREIYYLEIIEVDSKNILMRVGCEAGTYIRRLADDIGKDLKVGAHLQELRRTKSGTFTEDQLVTLQDVIDAYDDYKQGKEDMIRDIIKPIEIISNSVRSVIVKDSAVDAICNGAPVGVNGLVRIEEGIEKDRWVLITSQKGELIAIGKATMNSEDMLNAKTGFVVKTDSVIMERGTYPKMWKGGK